MLKSGKVKAVVWTVSAVEVASKVAAAVKSVQSTVAKEVKETDEPGGAKVKLACDAADDLLDWEEELRVLMELEPEVVQAQIQRDARLPATTRDDVDNVGVEGSKGPKSKSSKVEVTKKKVHPNAKSSKGKKPEVQPGDESLWNVASFKSRL